MKPKQLYWTFLISFLTGMKFVEQLFITDPFSALTDKSQKLWFLYNQRLQTTVKEGYIIRADSTYSYFELNARDSVKIVTWIAPDISLGNGILTWHLSKDTLWMSSVPRKIVAIRKDTLWLSEHNGIGWRTHKYIGRKG